MENKTAEEFYRNKFKEKHSLTRDITLHREDIDLETAMRWAEEYHKSQTEGVRDVEKLREDWEKRCDYIKNSKNVATDEIWNFFLPRLSLPVKEVTEEKWISVEDEQPEIGKIVLFVLKHSKLDVYAGFRAKGGWYAYKIGEDSKQFIPNNFSKDVSVTHWQPLPQSPK